MDTGRLIKAYREIATSSNYLADWLIRSHTGDVRAQALARALQAKLARLTCLEPECAPPGSPYYEGQGVGIDRFRAPTIRPSARHTAPTSPAMPAVRRVG